MDGQGCDAAAEARSPSGDGSSTLEQGSIKILQPKVVHLCVLIHGLWGHPSHLDSLASCLKSSFSNDLCILQAKTNDGVRTYDGIDLGGERVAHEVEQEIRDLEANGKTVKKISIIGYSLGGLIARYVAALLFSKSYFERIIPTNFITIASPHLGTRTPTKGWQGDLFNAFASRTLSASGAQLWALDSFRDTGKPLLTVLAEQGGVFLKALTAFKHRTLYANIINDRAVPFYTAFISQTDPFVDLSAIDIHYAPNCENVMIDTEKYVSKKQTPLTPYATFIDQSRTILSRAPFYFAVGVFGPIAAGVYLTTAAVQSVSSAQRIRLHTEGDAGIDTSSYNLTETMKRTAEEALGRINAADGSDLLEEEPVYQASLPEASTSMDSAGFPILALTREQFDMKNALDGVGFEKFAVHIHRVGHSHAAIIVRSNRIGFGEGKIVLRHLAERFEI